MTIYLYVKKHNKTGLKYLGKTTRDPFKYNGSGLYWKRHLKTYGNDITTEILYQTQDEVMFKEYAIRKSLELNVVESNEWANIRHETGNGGFSENARLLGYKNGIGKNLKFYGQTGGQKNKGKVPWNYGKKLSLEHKAKLAESNNGKLKSDSEKNKISASLKKYYEQCGNISPNKGKVRKKVKCPYCDKEGAMNTMSRWHFDKCKYKA